MTIPMDDGEENLPPLAVGDSEGEVARMAAAIATNGGDNEMLHCDEDALLYRTLRAIATGKHFDSPADLAAAALKLSDLNYSRWYA